MSLKTMKMVEKGLVLDDHGAWVPLDEKLDKERFFIKQLEMGNVLLGKKWVPIKTARCAIEPLVQGTESDKESIDDTEASSFHDSDISDKCGVPDETEIDETNDVTTKLDHPEIVHNRSISNKKPVIPDHLFYGRVENETVLFNVKEVSTLSDSTVKKVKVTAKSASVPIYEDVKGLLQSFEEFEMWEKAAKKRQAVFWAIGSSIAAIIGCAAFLFLLFS